MNQLFVGIESFIRTFSSRIMRRSPSFNRRLTLLSSLGKFCFLIPPNEHQEMLSLNLAMYPDKIPHFLVYYQEILLFFYILIYYFHLLLILLSLCHTHFIEFHFLQIQLVFCTFILYILFIFYMVHVLFYNLSIFSFLLQVLYGIHIYSFFSIMRILFHVSGMRICRFVD